MGRRESKMKLPKHEASLTIRHNQHKDYYQSIEDYTEDYDNTDWISEEDKQKCIDTNELWEIQWYPITPVGFHMIIGSSLELVLKYANEDD